MVANQQFPGVNFFDAPQTQNFAHPAAVTLAWAHFVTINHHKYKPLIRKLPRGDFVANQILQGTSFAPEKFDGFS